MGLNAKDIQLRLFKAVNVSAKSSYTFLQKHPLVSGALLVFLILYISLSYIYSFLVYMSPFLVCIVIFVRIFWSSEQLKTQLRYVKKEEEKGEEKEEEKEEEKVEEKMVEPKYPKILNNRRHELLFKYPSHNATSRRRNFNDKKWDVYGDLEERGKDLSEMFHNEFIKRNKEKKEAKYFEKGESSLNNGLSTRSNQVPKRHILRTEPSMVDLVVSGDLDKEIKRIEDGDDDDEEEAQENKNKIIEWTEDDQKNLMNLGISEMERNKRLESLIARRKARKFSKQQLENNQIDKKPIAPVLTTRGNPFDSSKDFEDCIEMPGSAPSIMPRSPYDIPYDPSEEKPNLTRDSFLQEFSCHQKDMPISRYESFCLGHTFPLETKQDHGTRDHHPFNNGRNERLEYSRFRRPTDKGNHDQLIDQLIYDEGGERGYQAPNPLRKEEETTHEDDEQCKSNIADMKNEEVKNDHGEANLVSNMSNIEAVGEAHGSLHGLPISTTSSNNTTINESMYENVTSVVDKRQENAVLSNKRLCHAPSYSIASDLQVEVSEVGSPTSTVNENAETNSSSDGDSIPYDGDIDRDASSGSEELWGASFHGGKEAPGVRSEKDNTEQDVVSPIALQHMDEENVADVSSVSSKCDMFEDTPTCVINSDRNTFGYMQQFIREFEEPQSSNYSHFFYQLPDETHPEKQEEWCNLPESVINEAQVNNGVNNSATIEQDNTENATSSVTPSTSVRRQESIYENSIYPVSSSPRSVLPDKTTEDEVASTTFNQDMHVGAQQSNMETMAIETLTGENQPDTMPQTIQPLMDDTINEPHNIDFNHSREHIDPLENSNEKSNISGRDVCNKEEQEELRNDENNEDNSNNLNRQELTIRPINEIPSLQDMGSRDLDDDKIPSTKLIEDDTKDKPSSSSIVDKDLPKQRIIKSTVPNKETIFDIFD